MAVFSSEIVPGDELAVFRGGGFGSPEGDSKVFGRVKDQTWQAGTGLGGICEIHYRWKGRGLGVAGATPSFLDNLYEGEQVRVRDRGECTRTTTFSPLSICALTPTRSHFVTV